MKRTVLILVACILLISPALALGLSRSRLEPPPSMQLKAQTKFVPPYEGEVIMTLRPVIITVPARAGIGSSSAQSTERAGNAKDHEQ